MSDFIEPFIPHPLIRGGDWQTIAGSRFPGNGYLPPRKVHKIPLDPASALMVYELASRNVKRPMVLLSHGMAGCSESGYMRRMANKLWVQGFCVFMMNQRGAGVGMGLCDRLWHGGSSEDLEQVIQYLVGIYPHRPLLLVGFSLSGNVLLKYLGEGRKIPSSVHGAFAVNPPIDLKVAAAKLSEGKCRKLYNPHYMKLIHRQVRGMAECHPEVFHPGPEVNSIWEFDEKYTAPSAGYDSREDYYEKCSARRFLETIRVPTVMLCSSDDPFIPMDLFRGSRMSLAVHYMNSEFGGHMGYIAKDRTPLGDRRWMDYVIVEWAKRSP